MPLQAQPATGDEPLTVTPHPARMIRTILCRIRQKHVDGEGAPLPYEQAILVPEPVSPDYNVALTEDGKRFLALEPSPRAIVPVRRRRLAQPLATRMMDWSSGW